MDGDYVVDTNIIIALFDHEPAVKERFVNAAQVLVPSIVIGELYLGAYCSRRASANVKRVDTFAESHIVVSIDADVAQSYGFIKSQLRQKGTPIPNNDIGIAAIAKQLSATLVSRDDHFRNLESLMVEDWKN